MKKVFYFVRHGETDWNKLGRIQGLTDIPLNETGIAQAENLAKKLTQFKISHVYSSPLKRANKTADIISNKLGLKVKVNSLLREVCFGTLEGQSTMPDDIKKLFESITTGTADINNINLDSLHIERIEDIVKRFTSFVNSIPENENNILVVSHGAFIKTILLKFIKENIKIGNCACFAFEYDTLSKLITNIRCI